MLPISCILIKQSLQTNQYIYVRFLDTGKLRSDRCIIFIWVSKCAMLCIFCFDPEMYFQGHLEVKTRSKVALLFWYTRRKNMIKTDMNQKIDIMHDYLQKELPRYSDNFSTNMGVKFLVLIEYSIYFTFLSRGRKYVIFASA